MTLIGHARVSAKDQITDRQLDELRAAGCAEVFEEHASPGFAVSGHTRWGMIPGKPQISWVFAVATADNTPKY